VSRLEPVATYRLQLRAGVGFREASAIVPYLHALGVTHVFASPYLRAQRGSAHGYDVVEHATLDPALGTREDFEAFVAALRAHDMGHIVDFVPNHMGVASGENAWWNDVLENGPSSRFAGHFDVDFCPPKVGLEGRILYPILGDHYGVTLEKGQLRLVRDGGRFFLAYHEHALPIAPESLLPLFEPLSENVAPGEASADSEELASIVTALRNLPRRSAQEPARRVERAREAEVIERRLQALCESSPEIAARIDLAVARANGTVGDPASFDLLDQILRAQVYRLAFWRVATEEINCRRFFDINDLAAIRMEDTVVFGAAHALVFALIDQGKLDGLRLDHVEGLYDPIAYFHALGRGRAERPYVVVEKILERGERLPPGWEIDGTTGYELAAAATGLHVDRAAERILTETYRQFTGDADAYADHVYQAKRAIMRSSLAAEINVLARALERIAVADRRSSDFTVRGLTAAIVETIASFPVYRTYVRPDGSRQANDTLHVERAIRTAKRRNREVSGAEYDFVRDVLLLRRAGDEAITRFAMRFQQVTGAVMAKGVEDTAFYRFVRFVALLARGGRK
jgi:(1->4)-alpha-D-glucan 1-alpha-D-glucosylmutase